MSMITKQDRKILERQDRRTLKKWWWMLNTFGWPDQLPNEEVYVFAGNNPRRDAIMTWIDGRCGIKAILQSQPKKTRRKKVPTT